MQVTGIIAEYNPFHKGHIYHLKKTIEMLHPDVLVVLISSYFSQRGLPSLIAPEEKTRLALAYGADLVLELPCVYACQSADRFALYAVETLKTAGVTSIVFGSETNDIELLRQQADRLQKTEKKPSSSMARNIAEQAGQLGPNDILGVQYVRWCREFGITPYTIARNPACKSATQTRTDFFSGRRQFLDTSFLPQEHWQSYYPYLRLYLLLTPPARLASYFLVTEGIENRLVRLAGTCEDWDTFLDQAVTKTYSRARIQRTCLFILLQISREEMEKYTSFFALEILGMNAAGQAYLKTLPAGIPIYSRTRDLPPFLKMAEQKARILYTSVLDENIIRKVIAV